MKMLIPLAAALALGACANAVSVDTGAVEKAATAYLVWKIDRGEVPTADWSDSDIADFKFHCTLAGIVTEGVHFTDYPSVSGEDVNAACDQVIELLE